MKKFFSLCTICLLIPFSLSAKDLWHDPLFLQSFNGSYAINARIEPPLTSPQRGLLVSIEPLMAKNQRKEALHKLTQSQLTKHSAALLFNAANISFELDLLGQAQDYYSQALKKFPHFRRAHRNLGLVFIRKEQWKQAIKSLSKAISLGDSEALTYGQLAYSQMEEENFSSALYAYRMASLTQADSPYWKAGIAQCLFQLNRLQEAWDVIEELRISFPEDTSYALLSSSIALSLGKKTEALSALEFVRRLDKLNGENLLVLATLSLNIQDAEGMNKLFDQALQAKAPLSSIIQTLRFFCDGHQWHLAESLYKKTNKSQQLLSSQTLQEHKLFTDLQRIGARIDLTQPEHEQQALSTLKQLIHKDPLDGKSMLLLGHYYLQKEEIEKASLLVESVLELPSFQEEALYLDMLISTEKKDYQRALQSINKLLKKAPSQSLQQYKEALLALKKAAQ